MSCKIELDLKQPIFFLKKLAKKAPQDFTKLYSFLSIDLANCENPCLIAQAKHLTGFDENYYRWRISSYRIVGIVMKLENNYLIQIVKISRHNEKTYKNL